MKQNVFAAFAVVLALPLAIAACGSGGTAVPMTASTNTAGSLSRSLSPAEPPESFSKPPELTAAESFTTYAEGGRADVPWADPVTYSIEGAQVARFDAAFADRRQTWEGCPTDTMTYEGRDCPVSPLRTIALLSRDGGEVPLTVGCNRYQPAGAEHATTIWIRPTEQRRDCFSDFAVAVSLDRHGRVVSFDLALSGP